MIADLDCEFPVETWIPMVDRQFGAPVFGGYDELAAEKRQFPKAVSGACN